MKIKKTTFSTKISDLWGRDNYPSHINVGDEFWYFFSEDTDIFRESHKHWNKLKVTYVRSGCLFYTFPDYPDVKEDFCPTSCFMTSTFILAEIDPIKDLNGLIENIDSDSAKMMYRFDDEHTIVKNWPNEKEIEIDDEEILKKFVDNPLDYMLLLLKIEN